MRKIKFRALDKINKIMRYYFKLNSLGLILDENNKYNNNNNNKFILMQFIGLEDKNGKEIYEGDYSIDMQFNILSLIVFEQGSFKYADYKLLDNSEYEFVEFIDIDQYFWNKMDFSKNIYENPIILK